MPNLLSQLDQHYVQLAHDSEARHKELASLTRLRPILFWSTVVTTVTPFAYIIVLAILLHKPVAAPAMSWFVCALNLMTYLRVNHRIQLLHLLGSLPQKNLAEKCLLWTV